MVLPTRRTFLLALVLFHHGGGNHAVHAFTPTTTTTTLPHHSTRPLVVTSSRRQVANNDNNNDHSDSRRLVVVGGGIGGIASAYNARHLFWDRTDEIVVVSDQANFSFTPSNPWVAIRKRTPSEIQVPLKDVLPRHGIEFVHDTAVALQPAKNELKLKSGKTIKYDYMIIATGPRLAFDKVPGLEQAGVSVCTTPHAMHAATMVDKLVEDPGPVVIGAVQGSSCFGPAYEFLLLLQYELKNRGGKKLVDACPMTFVTPEPVVGHLGLDGAGESKSMLKKLLQDSNIEVFENTRTTKVTPTSVMVEQLDDNGKVVLRKTLPSKLTMMIPAFEGLNIWKKVPGLTDRKGLIVVNEHQQSTLFPNIFAVGIAVSMPQKLETVIPCGIPKTGYLIESQGTAAVKNIKTLADWSKKASVKEIKETTHDDIPAPVLHSRSKNNALCITDFGDDGAIFIALPQVPPRKHDWTIHSKLATLAKVAFEKYFLHKVEAGDTDPYYEKYLLKLIGVDRTDDD